MITQTKIKKDLECLSMQFPNIITDRLQEGQRIMNGNLCYIIDDPKIYKRLGNFQNIIELYKKIRAVFKTPKDDASYLCNGDYPFSEVYREGMGNCLEMGILFHLATQGLKESFLISGFLNLKNHAYNVIAEERLFLVDVGNPLDPFNKICPYIAPIDEIENCKFRVLGLWDILGQGRTYSF